jgi:hypothetical protein
VQHPRGIAHATGLHRPVDDWLRDVRRWPGVGLLQEKRTPTPQKTLPAPVARLPVRRRALSHQIRTLAIGTMQHVGPHGPPHTKVVTLVFQPRRPDQQL